MQVYFTSFARSLCQISSKWQDTCYLVSVLGWDIATDPGLSRGNCLGPPGSCHLYRSLHQRAGRVSRSTWPPPCLGCYWLLRSLAHLDKGAGNGLLEAAFLQSKLQLQREILLWKYIKEIGVVTCTDYINHPINVGITRGGWSLWRHHRHLSFSFCAHVHFLMWSLSIFTNDYNS